MWTVPFFFKDIEYSSIYENINSYIYEEMFAS